MDLIEITQRQNNMRFDNYSYKIELRNEIFRRVNVKGENKTAKKNRRLWLRKLYPVGMEAITSRKKRNYKEKTKGIFDRGK